MSKSRVRSLDQIVEDFGTHPARRGASMSASAVSFVEAAALVREAGPEILAFTGFPNEHWRQLWRNNSLERINGDGKRLGCAWAS